MVHNIEKLARNGYDAKRARGEVEAVGALRERFRLGKMARSSSQMQGTRKT